MDRGKDWHIYRRRSGLVALLVIGVVTLALASAASGGGKKNIGPSGYVGKGHHQGKLIGKGHGFGETYKARSSTLAHALFKASLLPNTKKPRNIALAALVTVIANARGLARAADVTQSADYEDAPILS